jgi:hypothetical protein
LHLTAGDQDPRPLTLRPFSADVHVVAGGFDTLSVPPGGRVINYEFTVPIG